MSGGDHIQCWIRKKHEIIFENHPISNTSLTLPAKTNVRLGEIFLGKINDNSCQAWFVHQ